MLQTTLVTYCSKMCIKTETIFLHSVSKTSQYSPNNPTSNCPPQHGNLKVLYGSLLSVVLLSEVNIICLIEYVVFGLCGRQEVSNIESSSKRLPKKVNVLLRHSLEWVNLKNVEVH